MTLNLNNIETISDMEYTKTNQIATFALYIDIVISGAIRAVDCAAGQSECACGSFIRKNTRDRGVGGPGATCHPPPQYFKIIKN